MSIQSPRIAETIRWVDDHVVKRIMRILLRVGVAPFAFALLETTGRRTGQRRLTPVGNGHIDDTFWLVAARGVRADYVKNLLADPDVRVKVGRQWYPGTAHVLPDDDPYLRLREIVTHFGRLRRLDARALESSIRLGHDTPVTVRIELESVEPRNERAPVRNDIRRCFHGARRAMLATTRGRGAVHWTPATKPASFREGVDG